MTSKFKPDPNVAHSKTFSAFEIIARSKKRKAEPPPRPPVPDPPAPRSIRYTLAPVDASNPNRARCGVIRQDGPLKPRLSPITPLPPVPTPVPRKPDRLSPETRRRVSAAGGRATAGKRRRGRRNG